MSDEIGLIGAGRMGRHLAANMMARDIAVRAWDQSSDAPFIGLPVPGLSTAAGHVDALRRSPLSTRFVQLHRDYFGAHTFRRIGQDVLLHGPRHGDNGS